MNLYRNVSTSRRWVRRAGVVVESGATFSCDFEIEDANFQRVEEEKVREKKPGSAPAQED